MSRRHMNLIIPTVLLAVFCGNVQVQAQRRGFSSNRSNAFRKAVSNRSQQSNNQQSNNRQGNSNANRMTSNRGGQAKQPTTRMQNRTQTTNRNTTNNTQQTRNVQNRNVQARSFQTRNIQSRGDTVATTQPRGAAGRTNLMRQLGQGRGTNVVTEDERQGRGSNVVSDDARRSNRLRIGNNPFAGNDGDAKRGRNPGRGTNVITEDERSGRGTNVITEDDRTGRGTNVVTEDERQNGRVRIGEVLFPGSGQNSRRRGGGTDASDNNSKREETPAGNENRRRRIDDWQLDIIRNAGGQGGGGQNTNEQNTNEHADEAGGNTQQDQTETHPGNTQTDSHHNNDKRCDFRFYARRIVQLCYANRQPHHGYAVAPQPVVEVDRRMRTDLEIVDVQMAAAAAGEAPMLEVRVRNRNNKFIAEQVEVQLIATDGQNEWVEGAVIPAIQPAGDQVVRVALPAEAMNADGSFSLEELAIVVDPAERFNDVRPENNVYSITAN